MFFKAKRWISKTYLDFVRGQPCCACGKAAPSEAHHWGPDKGMGRKASDVYVVPLCFACHAEWHQRRTLKFRDHEESMELQMLTQRDLLAEFVMRNFPSDDENQSDSTLKPPNLPAVPWTEPPPEKKSPGAYSFTAPPAEDDNDDVF